VFNETFGVTPTRYLQLKRLHEVHRTLRAADADETSVSHVLAQHNEWQLGRFAAQYRRLFGEKPSETLANKFP
jgi:AraC family ethanolamine operon transcriptional activator